MYHRDWIYLKKGLKKSVERDKIYIKVIECLRRKGGEGNGNPLQYFCLGNPMDGGAR